jgi:thiamine pyrophosphate-dependent acetolactate synthase large subunit-like protein
VHENIADSGGDRVARALAAHGVRQIFTLCGGHTAPILAAAKARGIRIIDVRHEVNAVFAADAYARLTGIPGVAVVTAGPGVSNTITALKNAQLAQSPLVLIGGAAPTALQGRGALQDIDQRALVAPHVKACKRVRRVVDLDHAVTAAFALARSGVPALRRGQHSRLVQGCKRPRQFTRGHRATLVFATSRQPHVRRQQRFFSTCDCGDHAARTG